MKEGLVQQRHLPDMTEWPDPSEKVPKTQEVRPRGGGTVSQRE